MNKEITKLLKIFVECPSYIDSIKGINENNITKIISSFFKEHFSEYKKIIIPSTKERNNLLFIPKHPKIIFCCHLDTVIPSLNNQLKLKVIGDKAYGLGTKDMKGGWVASILSVMQLNKIDREKIGFLFYCDEEYEQKGMEDVVKNSNKIPKSVKYLISPESRFNLTYGCRGYSIFEIECFSDSTHTSRPNKDTHPIEKLYQIYQSFKKLLQKNNTLTMLSIISGIKNEEDIIFSDSLTPNYSKATFSLRISDPLITEVFLKKIFTGISSKLKIKSKMNISVHRAPSKIIKNNFTESFIKIAKENDFKIEKANPNFSGYNDVAMLSHKLKIPFIGFGPYGEDNHGPNEWVSLKSIKDAIQIYQAVIRQLK